MSRSRERAGASTDGESSGLTTLRNGSANGVQRVVRNASERSKPQAPARNGDGSAHVGMGELLRMIAKGKTGPKVKGGRPPLTREDAAAGVGITPSHSTRRGAPPS